MRGKVLRATLGAPPSRITPAYAGKRSGEMNAKKDR